ARGTRPRRPLRYVHPRVAGDRRRRAGDDPADELSLPRRARPCRNPSRALRVRVVRAPRGRGRERPRLRAARAPRRPAPGPGAPGPRRPRAASRAAQPRCRARGRPSASPPEAGARGRGRKAGAGWAAPAAADAAERVAAKAALADVTLDRFVEEPLVPPDADE